MQIFFIRTIKEGYTGCPVIVRFIQRLFKIVLNITKHKSGIYLARPFTVSTLSFTERPIHSGPS